MAPARSPRGRTAPGRLRALDEYLLLAESELLGRRDGAFASAVVVDVGVGEHPWTTLELADALSAMPTPQRVIGVDISARRLEAARRLCEGRVELRRGGLSLPLEPSEPARVVRCMNVLRGEPPGTTVDAHRQLSANLLPGGLLLEGTSDRRGGVLTAHLLRRTSGDLMRESLLFFTDFSRGFAPILFRDHLPRDLRRSVQPGHALHRFFWDWTRAWSEVRLADARESFVFAAERLALRQSGVVADPGWVHRGFLLWRPADGVPLPCGNDDVAPARVIATLKRPVRAQRQQRAPKL